MADATDMQVRIQATGTWNIPGPISIFSVAIYRTADGRVVRRPISVASANTTWQIVETAASES